MNLSRLNTYLLFSVPIIFMFAFFVSPVMVSAISSFLSGTDQFSLAAYQQMFSNQYYMSTLWSTLLLSLKIAAVTIPLGYLIAYYIVMVLRHKLARRMVYLIVILPLFTSNIVRVLGFMVLLGRNGYLNSTLIDLGIIDTPIRFLYSELGVIIGLSYIFTPFMVLSISGALQNIDKSLLQASKDLGAGPIATFLNVVLPLSLPGVLAGSIIVITLSVSAYVTPSVMLGGRSAVMSMLIYEQYVVSLNYSLGAALAVTLMFTTLVMIGLYSYVFERKIIGGPRERIR